MGQFNSNLPSQWQTGLIRGVASNEWDNLAVIYHLNAYEIWPDKKRVAIGGSGLIGGDNCSNNGDQSPMMT